MITMPDTNVARPGLAPFSLKDAPALIERVFPAQKVGIEAQKERKANVGQTLTALGSYWKGRKPLVLVRATVLASLLPATEDPQADLEVFDLLMRMDEDGMWRRGARPTPAQIYASPLVSDDLKGEHIRLMAPLPGNPENDPPVDTGKDAPSWKPIPRGLSKGEAAGIRAERLTMTRDALPGIAFSSQVGAASRVEEIEDLSSGNDPLYLGIWDRVNHHLGTSASSIPQLVEQLGHARFGHRPIVGDPFAGGGSIPFEAARVGCDVVASDLNPVAAMLTWGALNIIGADEAARSGIAKEQSQVAAAVNAEVTRLGIEHDAQGNRAKAFLYCLETVDPQTGWRVPMSPSWVISTDRRCAVRMVPDYARKRFHLLVEAGLPADRMKQAALGTVRDGHLVYQIAPVEGGEVHEYRIPIARLRGDGEGPIGAGGDRGNRLRPWDVSDFEPREPEWVEDAQPVVSGAAPGAWVGGDILLERLYAIQWMNVTDIQQGKARPETWFAAPTPEDIQRERLVSDIVRQNLVDWQASGFVPDMRIEPGVETTRLLRERGWTHWHHLYSARSLLTLSAAMRHVESPATYIALARSLDFASKLSAWESGAAKDLPGKVFSNQALNTWFNYGLRGASFLLRNFADISSKCFVSGSGSITTHPAMQSGGTSDLWVYDPPYADAVNYHEITEFFIAWLRKNPPAPFNEWTWDSRRPLAIQGRGEAFRREMVAAFSAMARNMPDNGLQVCMFTHKDAGVWADMAGIVWASGLRVTAAWYVSTETSSELKKGGYVQGTVLLVLRKRLEDEYGYKSEIVPEVRARVQAQVETLTGLNQRVRGGRRDENLFSDADIQMAGYAAALEVLTAYTHIDGVDMTREALRPREERRRGQPAAVGLVEEMISLAVSTATELMVPEGIPEAMWDRLPPATRFYLRMAAAEGEWAVGTSGGKLDDYQNFAKAYRADGWEDLMAERTPNRARLKTATEFRAAFLRGHPVSDGPLRPTLYAIMSLARDAEREVDPETSGKAALHGLRDHFGEASWLGARDNVRALATWFGRTWSRRNPAEAAAARVLAGLIGSERL